MIESLKNSSIKFYLTLLLIQLACSFDLNFISQFENLTTISNDETLIGNKSDIQIEVSCQNPNNYELEKKLNKLRLDLLRHEQLMFAFGKIPEFDNPPSISESSENSFLIEKTIIKKEKSRYPCSWNDYIEYNSDRYPKHKVTSKCDRKFCSNFFRNFLKYTYNCLTVYHREPVLIRGECKNDGYFEWIPSVELVEKGCVSGINLKLISF
ncbi:unnamed protein product [Brachionus calyciflorus]|uniref:Uncharacterized protein n=1 Tax=Brachionus calyciflorus TaxID=104777 RepID=A0A814D7Q9_9BILA|nr:unnamed protein product [Brachionus calyciflorus]